MQSSLIVWYVVLMVELVTIIMMGYFYPYVSKWDKRKVKMPQWNDKRRPKVTILQRYKVSGMCVVATIYIVLDFFIMLLSERVTEIMNSNPWFVDILFGIVIAFAHGFIWLIMVAMSYMIAVGRVTQLYKKYRDKHSAVVINKTELEPERFPNNNNT